MRIAAGVLAAGAALWTYGPALDSYLVADDFQWVQAGLRFEPSQLLALSTRRHFYRPAVELYFAAAQWAAPCSARALHAFSFLVHLINAMLLAALVSRLHPNPLVAPAVALLFAVQPAPAEAVAWPSAVSTLLCATFGFAMLVIDLGEERHGLRPVQVAAAYAAALAAHESGVMFLPASLALRLGRGERVGVRRLVAEYGTSVAVLALFLAVTFWINARNYVVAEGHYAAGVHVLTNLLDYLVMLYAGHRAMAEYVLVSAVGAALLWRGGPPVRALTLWLLLALVPALPFAWGTSSRYAYIATAPFVILVSLGLIHVHDRAAARLGRRAAAALVIAAAMFGVVRSASFARKGARTFAASAAVYEDVAQEIRSNARVGRVTVSRSLLAPVDPAYHLPLASTALCDPEVLLLLR